MNENDYFDYFLEMGAMRPEDEKARRKQAMVDYLRAGSMQAPQAQQAGRVTVAPSWTQNLAQVAQGYMANRQQGALDEQYKDMTQQRRTRLDELRRKRTQLGQTPLPPEIEDEQLYGLIR